MRLPTSSSGGGSSGGGKEDNEDFSAAALAAVPHDFLTTATVEHALGIFCENGFTNCLQALMPLLGKYGVDVNDASIWVEGDSDDEEEEIFNTPLIDAAERGHDGCVALLLKHTGIDVNAVDGRQRSALLRAAQSGHAGIVKMLLAAPGIEVNHCDDTDYTALMYASAREHIECVRALLAVPSIDVNHASSAGGNTALTLAALEGSPACLEQLLAVPSINVNCSNTGGCTAALYADFVGDARCIQLLADVEGIQAGSDAAMSADTALLRAALYGNAARMQELHDIGHASCFK